MGLGTFGRSETDEAPSTKLQAPEKHQAPNIKPGALFLELRCLELPWSLELGAWSFFMSLLIKQGEIVTGTEHYIGDIFCEHERITHIDRNIDAPAGTEVINASGKYVFPGFIDPHVHIYLPFMGTFAKDTHETASRAALVGGTTTFIEMICPARNEKPLEAFELWLGKAQGNSACDFTFHMGVTRYDDEAERDFKEIVKRGLSSFKIFLAYKGAFGITDEELYATLTLAKKLGVIVTAHCENADLVLELQKKFLSA